MANVEALEQLRRVVEAAPEELFDMTSFKQERKCGTVHCAAGWAALDPWFRENTRICDAFAPDGGASSPWFALACLSTVFDIPASDARRLFGYTHEGSGDIKDVPKDDVLHAIDQAIDDTGIDPYETWDDEDEDDDEEGD